MYFKAKKKCTYKDFPIFKGIQCQLKNKAFLQLPRGLPGVSGGKESAGNAGDLGSIPGLGRSSGEGKGYPLQYSGLVNSMDSIVHGVAESDTTERLPLSTIQVHSQQMPRMRINVYLKITGSQLSYFKSWKMMLWKCCTQYASKFGKLSSGHRAGKGQFSFQAPRMFKLLHNCTHLTR